MPKIKYNKELDILVVEKNEYEDYSETLELDGFVLDLDRQLEFLGLEIIDVSQKIPLSKDELKDIQDVEVKFEKKEDYVRVSVIFALETGKSVISSQYPRTAIV